MFQAIEISNYRSIEHIRLEPGPLTVLLGKNASGKSNVVDALQFLADSIRFISIGEALLQLGRGSFQSVLYRRAQLKEIRFQIEAMFPMADQDTSPFLHYDVAIGPEALTGSPAVLRELLTIEEKILLKRVEDKSRGLWRIESEQEGGWTFVESYELMLAPGWNPPEIPHIMALRAALAQTTVFRFEPDAIRRSATIISDPRLGAYGEGLPALLDTLPHSTLEAIASELSTAVPPVKEIKLQAAEPGKKVIALVEEGEREPFYPDQISDGTLRFLALLAIAHGAVKAPLVIIEEPEIGIHPTRLFQVIELLRGQARRSGQQFILTTHAPYLVDRLEPGELALLTRRTGPTTIEPIPEPEELKKRLEEFGGSLGEMWFSGLLSQDGES